MNNNTRKIVVLNNLNSPRIEQAIFILREEADISECDAVAEAQKIVNDYLNSLSAPLKKPRKKIAPTFFLGMAIYTFAAVALTAYIMTMIA